MTKKNLLAALSPIVLALSACMGAEETESASPGFEAGDASDAFADGDGDWRPFVTMEPGLAIIVLEDDGVVEEWIEGVEDPDYVDELSRESPVPTDAIPPSLRERAERIREAQQKAEVRRPFGPRPDPEPARLGDLVLAVQHRTRESRFWDRSQRFDDVGTGRLTIESGGSDKSQSVVVTIPSRRISIVAYATNRDFDLLQVVNRRLESLGEQALAR